jgi:hypothetical protein
LRTAEQKELRNQQDRERRKQIALAASQTGRRGRPALPPEERECRRKGSAKRTRARPETRVRRNAKKAMKRKLKRAQLAGAHQESPTATDYCGVPDHEGR